MSLVMSEDRTDPDACDSPWRWDDLAIAAGLVAFLLACALGAFK